MGCDGVFVGSGIFKSSDPVRRARAIVKATAYFNDPEKLLEVSMDLGEPMPGLDVTNMPGEDGWRDEAGNARPPVPARSACSTCRVGCKAPRSPAAARRARPASQTPPNWKV